MRSGRVSRGGLKPVLALGALTVALTAGNLGSASADQHPTITGNTIVGETLTASPSEGGDTNYRWQRCNPATATPNCFNANENDSDYETISGAGGARQNTYTLTSADVGHFIRVQTHSLAEGVIQKWVASDPVGPVTAPAAAPQQPQQPQQSIAPIHGVQLLGQPTKGNVKFKPPGQKKFQPLSGVTIIPVGSIINTKKGTVLLTAATGEFGSQTADNSMEFFKGVFKIKQGKGVDAPATAKLFGKLKCNKGGKAGASSATYSSEAVTSGRRRAKRRLWGRGTGRYRTRGRGGTGSVRGTTWLTKDTCKGTFFKVKNGLGITVNPKKKGKKNVFLEPGEKYLAKL